MSNNITLDTESFGPLEAEIIRGIVQLFANQLVTAWTEITEAEDEGKRSVSFSASIISRKIEGKISGARKFAYKDVVFAEDPTQPGLGLEEDGEARMTISVDGHEPVSMTRKDLTDHITARVKKNRGNAA